MPARRLVPALAALVLACVPAAAHADLVAFVDVAGANNDTDLARIEIATGRGVAVPTGVNTTADELHPAVSPDGTKLVFERVDPMAGTRQIVLTDIASGTSAQLFSPFDTLSQDYVDPTWFTQPNVGNVVVVGAAPVTNSDGTREWQIHQVDVAAFPNGPFPSQVNTEYGVTPIGGFTAQPSVSPVPVANHPLAVFADERVPGQVKGTLFGGTGGVTNHVLSSSDSFDDPTISAQDSVVVAEHSTEKDGLLQPAQLYSMTLNLTNAGPLPAIVNATATTVERPQFSDDGRYLAFVRRVGAKHDKLFVWDTDTQLLLDSDGVDLGDFGANRRLVRSSGAIALHDLPLLLSTSVVGMQVSAKIANPSLIGIIVQRIVGQTTVLGHRAPKLRFVGRVPLGHFAAGRVKAHWDHRVGGHALAPGRYQVTVRAVTAAGGVRDLGVPVSIRIGAHAHR